MKTGGKRRQVAPRTGLVVDICRPHGVWFDAGEFEHFQQFVRAGGLDVVRFDGVAAVESQRKDLDAIRAATSTARAYGDDPPMPMLLGSRTGLGFDIIYAIASLFRRTGRWF